MRPAFIFLLEYPVVIRKYPDVRVICAPQEQCEECEERQTYDRCRDISCLLIFYPEKQRRDEEDVRYIEIETDTGYLRHERTEGIKQQCPEVTVESEFKLRIIKYCPAVDKCQDKKLPPPWQYW